MWNFKSSSFFDAIKPRLALTAVRLRDGGRRDASQLLRSKATANESCTVYAHAGNHYCSRRPARASTAGTAASRLHPCPPPRSSHGAAEQHVTNLDFVPTLGLGRELLCVLAPVLLVLVMFIATGRWHGYSWPARLASILFAAACVSLTRASWMELEYKNREREHASLGDSDSRFRSMRVTTGVASTAAGRRPSKQRDAQVVVHVKMKAGDLDGAGALSEEPGKDATSDGFRGDSSVFAVHCYHGFGANLESFKRVQEGLAAELRGVVTAHDMPGFGLTERPPDVSSYFLTFNGRLGRLVMDYELQQLGLTPTSQPEADAACNRAPSSGGSGPDPRVSATPRPLPHGAGVASTLTTSTAAAGGAAGSEVSSVEMALGDSDGPQSAHQKLERRGSGKKPRAVRRILLGHSMGGACAALEAVTDPEGLSGLVLVAPAIFAFPGPEYQAVRLSPDRPAAVGSDAMAANKSRMMNPPDDPAIAAAVRAATEASHLGVEPLGSHVTDAPEVRRLYPVGNIPAGSSDGGSSRGPAQKWQARLMRFLGSALAAVASFALLIVLRLLTPIITLLLRSLVRRQKFWVKGLQQAYYNPASVTPDIVDSYRQPQLVRGWEAGMVNFLLARLARPRASLGDLLDGALREFRKGAATASSPDVTVTAAAADSEVAAMATPPNDSYHSKERAAAGTSADDSAADDDTDLASRLAALVSARRLPVLIIHGLHDRLVPMSNSQRLARMLPGCELVLLDRCGHMPQEEMPGIFISLLTEFAGRIEVSTPVPASMQAP